MDMVIAVAAVAAAVLSLAALLSSLRRDRTGDALKEDIIRANDRALASAAAASARQTDLIDQHMKERQDVLRDNVTVSMAQMEQRLRTMETMNEQKLEAIRVSMEQRLQYLQEENNRRLDEMRRTVDEKLQKTLEDTMTQSFRLVNERLEQVYKGLGEMQTLASGVGDLKKVLSNVKTRGILGEIQLGAILEEILAPEQYEMNVVTVPSSTAVVEFAVRLPGADGEQVYLPIDSKFPADAYTALQEAYDSGSAEAVNAAAAVLMTRIKGFAKDIRDKYIEPPYTTDFAIMFLPFEGLYAEAVNRGLVEILQREYKVNLAGPSTMAALLNSLQMGFRTLAIQKQSGEVWKLLGAVRTEFDKFGDILSATQTRLEQAHKELDKLVGVRTRAIQRRLRDVERLDAAEAAGYLEE
ncbi:MAG: DNA recombination protein RmuC [Clostridia bacterium]|nr:DNA recombination protein RmuC [Clostridia bacterium]